uniref:ADAM metallopeptidase with thrombospondin type 1 motif 20 n=1 Tax=Nothobranchius furzeri TaxID=105023 RepID=A0A8C6Q4T0_NOTFU
MLRSTSLSQYEIITPLRVNDFGESFPHKLHYRRRRRSVNDDLLGSRLLYRIDAFGERFHLNLSADSSFIAPSYRVTHLGADQRNLTDSRDPDNMRHCFYRGHVNARSEHAAVFSLCTGLVSFLTFSFLFTVFNRAMLTFLLTISRPIVAALPISPESHCPVWGHCFYKTVVSLLQVGTFTTHQGEYFLEPLLNPAGEEYDEEHNKPHLVYRHERKKNISNPGEPCAASGNRQAHSNHCLSDFSPMNTYFLLPNNSSKNRNTAPRRHKRFLSYPRYVELMVTADSKMVHHHGRNLEHYILTIMSVVAAVYKDPSVGNLINIMIVKLVIIHDEQEGPTVNFNAATTLYNFCVWQQSQNMEDDSHPLHHDTALLITREDICGAKDKCDTLGLAELGTMCDPFRSCSISEENGISASFTIAHELGHVFNMPHDDNPKCREAGMKHQYHVMAPTLNYDTNPWSWSKCSRKYITEFLDTGYGECLLDEPAGRTYELPTLLPGQIYNANRQCELMFGPGSQICPYMKQCKRLWCTSAEGDHKGCRTQHMPLADGTDCGHGMYCRHGMCVNKELDMQPVHGQWGPWGPYSICSRSCGGGTRSTTRDCNKPEPRNGGKFCVGRRMKFRSCNTEPCPRGRKDFREEQCSQFDGKHFNINGLPPSVRWTPKYSGVLMKDRCKLFCRVAGTMAYYPLKDRVIDGTPCGPDTYDICVQGLCRQAGCDHVLNSKARHDKCGVCGGDNSSCKTLAGTFNDAQYGYNVVVRIPAGATNIDIKQVSYSGKPEDDNYLALADSQSNFLLNGNFVVAMFKREITFKGTVIEYSGSDTKVERINCTDRIEEELVLQVLCVGNLYNPDVRYSFNIPIEEHSERFVWDPSGSWLECSRICQGKMLVWLPELVLVRFVFVKVTTWRYLTNAVNIYLAPKENQDILSKIYFTDFLKCFFPQRWHVAGKSECSAKCGSGHRSLDVQCMKYSLIKRESERMEASACADTTKPQTREPCYGDCLLKSWQYSGWSQCLVTCGKGMRHRQVSCSRGDGEEKLSEHLCDPSSKPSAVGSCELPSCASWQVGVWGAVSSTHRHKHTYEITCPWASPSQVTLRPDNSIQLVTQWRYGSWTACSVSCGNGKRARYVSCRDAQGGVADESSCAHLPRPPEFSTCFSPCGQWHATEWSACSVTCGAGRATRQAVCSNHRHPVDQSFCDPDEKPVAEQECTAAPCPSVYTRQHIYEQPYGYPHDPGRHPGHSSWNVPSADNQWRTGPWGSCSSTCAGGFQRRVVVCQDADGRSNSYCDERVKPAESKSCDSGPCPLWNYSAWGECTQTCGSGRRTRLVVCQRPDGQRLNDYNCDILDKPPDVERCNLQPCPGSASWHRRPWKPVR